MKSLSAVLLLPAVWLSVLASAQGVAPDKYWIRFTDKATTPFSIDAPEAFLSERALERRNRQQIAITQEDLPVDPAYVQAVLDLGDINLIHQSKWFNAVTVFFTDSTLLESIQALPFVAETRSIRRFYGDKPTNTQKVNTKTVFDSSLYGPSFRQIEMLNGHQLHALGHTGEGMHIAVLDAGFRHVNELPVFEKARQDGRLHEANDLVNWWTTSVSAHHNHGTYVLSTMAGVLQDSLTGTAPDAQYWLFRTENGESELIIEEHNWVAAAEQADSIGVDLINTSLGYSTFDFPEMDHSYDDLDGETTFITRASTIAASKGMLLCTSAGNKGQSAWRYITAPADARDVLTVGAVNPYAQHAPFSSFGPSADGRVKPDVMAMGQDAVFADTDSTIRIGNGTSFSSPILCGLAACLWQAHPNRTAEEIRTAIIESAHLYSQPNDSMGYGIPDFWQAHLRLRGSDFAAEAADATVYPNPASNVLFVEWNTPTSDLADPVYRLYAVNGQLMAEGLLNTTPDRVLGRIDLGGRALIGLHILELEYAGRRSTQQVVFVREADQ